MRAGSFDRIIVVQRATETVSAAGTVTQAWATLGELRAELVTIATVESGTAFGEIETAGLVFRTRWFDLTTADRILFDGEFYNVRSIAEIGRRRGLELRVERAA